jgi:hypothetical protein
LLLTCLKTCSKISISLNILNDIDSTWFRTKEGIPEEGGYTLLDQAFVLKNLHSVFFY